ncbi:rho guanine nucleotide exchange factor 2 isoform X1 [Microcaecilia unicolor]|uniref:Rho guanine nucleotide exchange factor 2 n=1 Tax=Microcaecilia unicolor TaxID=1415580 RepID=A0A6P7WXE3_9AMPH|nr:rho guanine nucleotide exchange factor 2 isoform X1 [Microcaecilia unicolor]
MSGSITDLLLPAGDGAGYPLRRQKIRCMSAVEHLSACGPEEEEEGWQGAAEEEELDSFLGVPLRRSCRLRTSVQSHDAFRRHSWEPGKELQSREDYEERSASLKGLDPEEIENTMGRRRDPRRVPIIHSNEALESLFSPEEEDEMKRLRGASIHSEYFDSNSLSKSVSMTGIDHTYSSQEDVSFGSGRYHINGFGSLSQLDTVESGGRENERREESTLERTLSFIKKVTGGKGKNKEKEKMKEREKEARDKDARYTNGHLFTTITISGMTMCFACNKSITAKEALICPTCNVTIHNRCKDALPSCTKVKQKQQKAAFQKNNSALQGVSLRNKTTMIRERPNSAIYPSDSFRQSLLGSRRGRPSLSLSKSVSTTNIAGNLNDDSPLGIRRILSQSTDSLNIRNRTLSVESLVDEGAEVIYNQLMSDFEADEKDFEADSWSLAVDNNYLQQHKKEVMKRQDVIYELIQTEVHHVRTLKIMTSIFRKGMLDDLQMDPALVQNMFPCVDELSEIHVRFLTQLLERRRDSLVVDSSKNFVINRLGDILIGQFSGPSADQMKKTYSEFCSRHNKAMKLYKELFTRDKKFQQFVRRMTRSSVLRRHGVQECILLVTQRITKYPVLIDRILQNSKGNEVDQQDLATALVLVKDLISAIDQEVHECEKNLRLQDIYNRVDNRAATLIHGNRHFRKEELLRRRLIHDGTLLWKAATGRFKDVLVLLMTDVLIFLQEKDQKYTFPALDKPVVISLQNLIVRDIANQEKGMFLISAAPPEMYEVHTASREDRNTWMKVIQQSVRVCPKREDFPLVETEDEAYLRKLKDEIQQKDREIVELLEEKVSLFAEVTQFQAGEEATSIVNSRNLFRAESSESPRGERMVNEAIKEVEGLKETILGAGFELLSAGDQNYSVDLNSGTTTHPNSAANGEMGSINGSVEFCRTDSESSQKDRNGNQLQQRTPQEEVFHRLTNLYGLLHSLQAVVVQQDTALELQLQDGAERKEKLVRSNSREGPLIDVALRTVDKQGTELTLLQRQHALLQEELRRCRKQCEEKVQEAAALEARFRESEQARTRLEREVEEARRQVAAAAQRDQCSGTIDGLRSRRVLDPRRRSLPVGDALYLSFTPPQVSQDLPAAAFTLRVDDGSEDELSDLTELERLQEGANPEAQSEENGGQQSSPSSPRDFQRMQDIPEESETSQELRDIDPGSSES